MIGSGSRVHAWAYGWGFPRFLVGEPAVVVRVTATRALLKFPHMPNEPERWARLDLLRMIK